MAGVNSGSLSVVFPQLLVQQQHCLSQREANFSPNKGKTAQVQQRYRFIHYLCLSALYDMRGHFHALAALLPGKETRDLPKRRVIGSQNRSGLCGKEKNLLLLLEIETHFLGCRVRNQSQYRLSSKSAKFQWVCCNFEGEKRLKLHAITLPISSIILLQLDGSIPSNL